MKDNDEDKYKKNAYFIMYKFMNTDNIRRYFHLLVILYYWNLKCMMATGNTWIQYQYMDTISIH